LAAPESLEKFFDAVRSSCDEHAKRKGYMTAEGDNVLSGVLSLLDVEQAHAIGEIITKLLEFRAAPRQVLAEKISGWSWVLWNSLPSEEPPKDPTPRYEPS
jgi:hypothetical protein